MCIKDLGIALIVPDEGLAYYSGAIGKALLMTKDLMVDVADPTGLSTAGKTLTALGAGALAFGINDVMHQVEAKGYGHVANLFGHLVSRLSPAQRQRYDNMVARLQAYGRTPILAPPTPGAPVAYTVNERLLRELAVAIMEELKFRGPQLALSGLMTYFGMSATTAGLLSNAVVTPLFGAAHHTSPYADPVKDALITGAIFGLIADYIGIVPAAVSHLTHNLIVDRKEFFR